MQRLIRIAVAGWEFGYLRWTLRGIRDFAQTQPEWLLHAGPSVSTSYRRRAEQGGGGIIAHLPSRAVCRLAAAGVPMVTLYEFHATARVGGRR